jgi:hypothetical protein
MPASAHYAFRFTAELVTATVESVIADGGSGIDLAEAARATLLPEFSATVSSARRPALQPHALQRSGLLMIR